MGGTMKIVRYCIKCGKELSRKRQRKFCSPSCKTLYYRNRSKYNNKTVNESDSTETKKSANKSDIIFAPELLSVIMGGLESLTEEKFNTIREVFKFLSTRVKELEMVVADLVNKFNKG